MLGVSILLTMTLARFVSSGPFWPFIMDHLIGNCERYWWSTALFIQNYVNPTSLVNLPKCCDSSGTIFDFDIFLTFLFQVFSAFVVSLSRFASFRYLAFRCLLNSSIQNESDLRFAYRDFGLRWIHVCSACDLWYVTYVSFCSIYFPASWNFINWFHLNLRFSPRKYDLDHYPTHSRLSSWLIGVIAGYFFVEFPQRSINIPKVPPWNIVFNFEVNKIWLFL